MQIQPIAIIHAIGGLKLHWNARPKRSVSLLTRPGSFADRLSDLINAFVKRVLKEFVQQILINLSIRVYNLSITNKITMCLKYS